jgi:hypothetical protein
VLWIKPYLLAVTISIKPPVKPVNLISSSILFAGMCSIIFIKFSFVVVLIGKYLCHKKRHAKKHALIAVGLQGLSCPGSDLRGY